jgi:hypothetical protein
MFSSKTKPRLKKKATITMKIFNSSLTKGKSCLSRILSLPVSSLLRNSRARKSMKRIQMLKLNQRTVLEIAHLGQQQWLMVN